MNSNFAIRSPRTFSTILMWSTICWKPRPTLTSSQNPKNFSNSASPTHKITPATSHLTSTSTSPPSTSSPNSPRSRSSRTTTRTQKNATATFQVQGHRSRPFPASKIFNPCHRTNFSPTFSPQSTAWSFTYPTSPYAPSPSTFSPTWKRKNSPRKRKLSHSS